MQKDKVLTGYPSIDKPWMKYYSEEAINATLPECTIYEYLYEKNKDYLANTALNYFERKITFGELFENIDKTAKAFQALGVQKGDIVVISSVTIPETVYAFYALNLIGAISNMVDPRTSEEGIREYITEVDAKYVMTLDMAYPKIKKASEGTKVERIVVVSPADSLPNVKKQLFCLSNRIKGNMPKPEENCVRWKEFICGGLNEKLIIASYEKNSCCVIVHTGGTTGTPKGVMLSNDNVNALVFQSILTGIDMKREHTWLDIMPPFIAYGVGMGLHLPLVIGMETILIPSFQAEKFDELLIKHKPVHMVGVPSYWGTIINSQKLKHKDLSYMIAPTVGGDTMNEELEKSANAYLKAHGCNYSITKGYGMTEVCAGVTGTLDDNNEIGSVGVPFVKSVVAIFDPETGKELPYNEIGEICISGPNLMLGYYNNKEATDRIIKVHADNQKWVHSGDLGYINERGSLFVVDRMKRMIVRYDGFKVFPSLIEKVIAEHSAVETCCAVGMSDREHSQGKLPVVYVVLKNGYKNQEEKIRRELSDVCKKEIPEYAQPVEYVFMEGLPLTSIGKVDYRALEKQAEGI